MGNPKNCKFVGNKAKGRISKRVFQESKARQNFRKNKHFLPPDTHTYVCVSGGKKCLFFGNFGVLCFLETPVLRFALLPYYRRIMCLEENMQRKQWDLQSLNLKTKDLLNDLYILISK